MASATGDLAKYTTLRLGGPAERTVIAETEDDLVAAVRQVCGPLLVLAGGSNVVIGDSGFPGTVVLLRTSGINYRRVGDRVFCEVAAGHPWDACCAETVAEGLAGLECLSGVPGSAGATPVQNVGAYGQDVSETINQLRVYDRDTDQVVTMPAEDCRFGYRSSRFKGDQRYVVLSVTFELAGSATSTPVRYAELATTLGVELGQRAPLDQVRSAVLKLRAGKGMVSDPHDPDTWSVGSFFTNPVLDAADFARLVEAAERSGVGQPPAWPVAGAAGSVKTSAAWLIGRAGFERGYGHRGSGVSISTKHTLALTHRGGGSTAALLELAREIRDGVAMRFDVELRAEPVLVGCSL